MTDTTIVTLEPLQFDHPATPEELERVAKERLRAVYEAGAIIHRMGTDREIGDKECFVCAIAAISLDYRTAVDYIDAAEHLTGVDFQNLLSFEAGFMEDLDGYDEDEAYFKAGEAVRAWTEAEGIYGVRKG